jgi:hypothetical protein
MEAPAVENEIDGPLSRVASMSSSFYVIDRHLLDVSGLSALQAGYDVYGVIDASGTWSPLDHETELRASG